MFEYDQLIVASLQKELRRYKEELQLWKLKYSALEKQHHQLLELLNTKQLFQNLNINKNHQQQNAFLSHNKNNTEQASIQFQEQQCIISSSSIESSNHKQDIFASFAPQQIQNQQQNQFKKVSPFGLTQSNLNTQPDELLSPERSPRLNSDDFNDIDFFSIDQIKKHTSCQEKLHPQMSQFIMSQQKQKKGLQLIEGYFILQKIQGFRENIKNHNFWVKTANQFVLQKQKNLLEIIYRYTFRQEPLSPIEDDPFDSRVNQIKYGTPYEELIYAFDNFQPNEEDKSKVFFKTIRKKYVHCLIRPQITQIQGKQFQTEIIYGFISPFPFRTFFQDLHRTLQQEIKFQIINSCKDIPEQVQISKQTRIKIVSNLMKNVFEKVSSESPNIENFPINITMQTKVSTLKLQIQSQDSFKLMERQNLQILLKKYNLLKLCKIIHYVLTEKQIILVSTSRKNLNEIFQIVRLMMKPFFWVFPIVYRYSDHFQPFLSSPLPLIIGIVFDFNNKNYKDNKILMSNQFVTIFVEENNPAQKQAFFFFSSNKPKYSPNDLRQLSIYEKDIQFLYKYLTKPEKKSKSNQSQKIQKYVNRLRKLILTGSLDTELSTFMIEFLDTQMVQSFRDLLTGSNRKLNEHEDTNQDLMMTK